MREVKKTKKHKILSLVSFGLTAAMLFTMLTPALHVKAAGITFPIFDQVTLTDNTLHQSVLIADTSGTQALGNASHPIGKTDDITIDYHFAIANHVGTPGYQTVSVGDTYHFNIPSQLCPVNPLSNFGLKDSNGITIATVNLTAGGAGTLTITASGAALSDITGDFIFSSTFAGTAIANTAIVPISFSVDGQAQPYTVDVTFNQPTPVNQKQGVYNATTGKITWTVDLNTANNTIPAGSSITDQIKGFQTYDNQTFKIVDADNGNSVVYDSSASGDSAFTAGAAPASLTTVTGTLSYTFTYDFTHHYKITYVTTVTDPSQYFGGTNKVGNSMTFTHSGWANQQISAASVTIPTPDYIKKSGSFSAGTYNWTITFDNGISQSDTTSMNLHNVVITDQLPTWMTLDHSSVKINGTSVTEDLSPTATSKYGLTSLPQPGQYIIVGDKVIYNAGDVSSHQTLTFSTNLGSADYRQGNSSNYTFNNTGIMWANDNVYLSGGHATASSGPIGTGMRLISKSTVGSYNTATHEMQWQITVNQDGSTLPAGTMVADTMPDDLQYKNYSFSIDGTPPAGSTFNYDDATKILTYTFGDVISGTYHLTYTTLVTDPNIFANNASHTYNNTATLTNGSYSSSSSASQTATSDVISKSVTYDYVNRELNWTITVNNNLTALSGVHIIDALNGTNMSHFTLDTSSVQVDGATITTSSSPYPFTYTGGSGGTLDISLGNITDKKVITFSTVMNNSGADTPETFFADNLSKSITNSAKLTDTNSGFPQNVTTNANCTISNNLLAKTGIVTPNGSYTYDYVDWSVQINQNAINLQNVVLSDTLSSDLSLDTASVKLYQQTLNSNGSYSNPLLLSATNYSITYNATTGKFTFTMPASVSSPYLLTFRTYATTVPINKTIHNTITFNGAAVLATSNDATASVHYTGASGSASGTTGSITVSKQDSAASGAYKNLAGATFVLNDGYATRTATTGSDGKALFSLLRYGSYTITETTAPANYQLDTTSQSVTISSTTPNVTYTAADTLKTGTIKFTKLGDSSQPLTGAGFTLSGTQANGVWSSRSVFSDVDGLVQFDNVLYGTYTLTETDPPAGYKTINPITNIQLLDSNSSITDNGNTNTGNLLNLDTGTTDGTHILTASDRTDTAAGTLTVTKTDADTGALLPGAALRLTNQADSSKVYTPSSASAGSYVFTMIPLGTYTLTETSAPADYDLATITQGQGQTITFAAGTLGDLSVRVKTASLQDSRSTGSVTFTKTDGSQPLAGAQFGLFYDQSGTSPVRMVGDQSKTVISNTTASDGNVIFASVPYGNNYWVREIKRPANHNTASPFQISLHQPTLTVAPMNNPVVNTLKTGKIKFTKTDGYSALSGAQFTISGNGITPQTVTSDSDGLVQFINIPYSTSAYTITENSSPDELVYKPVSPFTVILDDAVEIDPNSANQTFSSSTFTAANGTTPNTLTIDNIVDTPVGSITITKVDNGDNSILLSGADFIVYDSYTKISYTSGSVTDANGNLTFNNLPLDPNPSSPTVFTVTEVTPPANYELNSASLVVKLYNSAGKRDSVVNNLYGDSKKVATVSLHKQDQYGDAVKGAEFTLYEEVNGKAQVVSAPGLANPVNSDKDGLVQFTNLPYGSYFVQETLTPADYIGNTSKISFNLSDQNEQTSANPSGQIVNGPASTHMLDLGVVKNTLKKGSFQFVKKGSSGPISGAVFTLYSADGTTVIKDSNGNPVTVTSAEGTGLVKFMDIPYGNYILKETAAPKNYAAISPVSVSLHDSTIGTDGVLTLNDIIDKLKDTTVTVHVTDGNGKPLPGNIIVIIDENGVPLGPTAITDSNGNATFNNVPYGNYQIKNVSSKGSPSIAISISDDDTPTSYKMQSNPKTGDSKSPPIEDILVLAAGSAAVIIAKKIRYRLKRKTPDIT